MKMGVTTAASPQVVHRSMFRCRHWSVGTWVAGVCLCMLLLSLLKHNALVIQSPSAATGSPGQRPVPAPKTAAVVSPPTGQKSQDSKSNVGKNQKGKDSTDSNQVPEVTSPTWTAFYDLVEKISPCVKFKMYGGQASIKLDGQKGVCHDGGLSPRPGNCLVLSFGINNEWSFDDAMEQYGCKVFAFDPTMNTKEHIRGKSVHFLPVGLGGKTSGAQPGQPFQVYSYRDILGKINKTDSVIDYLKIDIEGYEVDFFQNVLHDDVQLLANVKQIGMEIHPGNSEPTRDKLWRHMHRLLDLGFTSVSREINTYGNNSFTYNNKRESCCYEIVWVNTRLK